MSDGNPRESKRARLPQFRTTRPRKVTPSNSALDTSTSSVISVHRSTANGRIKTQERERVRVASPSKESLLPEEQPTPTQPELEDSPAQSPPEVPLNVPPKPKRKRVNTTKSRLVEWLELRNACLDEILRHDGPLCPPSLCAKCSTRAGIFRCNDCGHGHSMRCTECIVIEHADLELHRTEKWNGSFFEKAPLHTLGLKIQLGHDGGKSCPSRIPGPQNFLVFDVSGVHQVNVDFCGCLPDYELDKRTQLLRKRWFPATTTRPQTVFTFDCLDTFHELTLQGKTSLYDYYHVILRKTDNANVRPSIYRYPEMHRAFRLWRNLLAFKRAGRGHDPTGVDGTPPGGLMVECPACPSPGRNLPDGWQDVPPAMRFLYILYLAIDANFKLKGKDRKISDIELTPGLGAFVNEAPYQDFIKDYVDQPEINTCESEHDALVRASIRRTPGYAVTGAGLVICSRHVFVRGNGAGDLQKGEKYCNMDYIALSSVIGIILLWIIFTYDIGCQWSKNLQSRMEDFPEHMRIDTDKTKVDIAIPSWHIKGHGSGCQANYNLGYLPGAGRTCGDEIESSWAHTNPLAGSVREMGPGARHETLNDHWNGWNYRKMVGIRIILRKKFIEAAFMKAKHEAAYKQLTATFAEKTVKGWEKLIEKWEANPKARNPYLEPTIELSVQDVRLELLKEESERGRSSTSAKHNVSMTGFLTMGLDLEDRQYQLRSEVAQTKNLKTSKQKADVQEKRNALQRQITNWRRVQLVYTPHAATILVETSPEPEDARANLAENISLHLPSSFPSGIRSLSEMKRICSMEYRLRYAVAHDALAMIRRQRRIIQGLWQFKKINVSGTGNRPNTRLLTTYKQVSVKLMRAAQKYRTARAALEVLDPGGDWQKELQVLRQEDIRGPGKDPDESEGRYVMSWIWTTRKADSVSVGTEAEFNESMRVEWSKARARMLRWQEEYAIVQEEIRRVIAWFEWKEDWWKGQAARRENASSDVLIGISAYAHKQANLMHCMALRCAADWVPVLKNHEIQPAWATNYPTPEISKPKPKPKPGENDEFDEDEDSTEVLDDDDSLDVEEITSDSEELDSPGGDDIYFDYDD